MTVPVASAVPKVPVVSVIEARFARLLAGIVGLGAAVRLLYVLTDHRPLIGGDSLAYRLDALRIADGQGYTSGFGNVGTPTAHHPPAWVTVLAAVSWLGGRSELAHQLVGVVIGLGVIAVAGLVGRRYFNERVGLIAAVVAALYPGFWVLEGNVLSEPLTLLLIGILTLAIAGLKSRPTLGRSAAVGALCGLTALPAPKARAPGCHGCSCAHRGSRRVDATADRPVAMANLTVRDGPGPLDDLQHDPLQGPGVPLDERRKRAAPRELPTPHVQRTPAQVPRRSVPAGRRASASPR